MSSNKIEKQKQWRNAFTLAEVLITLGVIAVVAGVTMPTLVANIQERVRKEQVRTVKYKLTKATDSMKSLDKIGNYDSTKDFVDELKKHMSIAKVCDSGNLTECWPTEKINTVDGEKNISSLTTGSAMTALAVGSGARTTMGIVTGDGVPMIMVYAKNCMALDPVKSYTWSVVDGKPETNATTNCISAIFDINGAKGPNKIGQDVRTLNSLFGYKLLTPQSITKTECDGLKSRLGLNYCYDGDDYYAGAVKACYELGLHLPSLQTLANLAGAIYGRTDISTYTLIMKNGYNDGNRIYEKCTDYIWGNRLDIGNLICVDGSISTEDDTPIPTNLQSGAFWSSDSEVNVSGAFVRNIYPAQSVWYERNRHGSEPVPLCVGD